ncbi:MAG: hypothetical protein NTZ59_04000, partial [Bacteroidetes bacterium]|nr:hypothetical protein [Bacteroidota bacterium]
MSPVSKILLKGFIFSLPLILMAGLVEYKLRTAHTVSSYATKKYYIEQQLDSIETLVVGNSQMFNGIDVGCFSSKSFNLANVSQTLYYDRQLTLQYLPKLPKLKTVIIGISYFSFFYELCDIQEHWREDFYATHYNIAGCKKQNSNLLYLTTYQPQQAFTLACNLFKDAGAATIFYNGYQPKYQQKEISDSSGLQRVNIHNTENYTNRRLEIENNLELFIKQLHSQNINVVFVTMPVYNTYYKYCNTAVIQHNTQLINTLCKKYSCRYLNFFTDARFV